MIKPYLKKWFSANKVKGEIKRKAKNAFAYLSPNFLKRHGLSDWIYY